AVVGLAGGQAHAHGFEDLDAKFGRLLGGRGPGRQEGAGQGEHSGMSHVGPRGGQGLAAASQKPGVRWQYGQPVPYFDCTAFSRSMFAMLASVASQASTSANSNSNSAWFRVRSDADSSPTSSMNHIKVPSMPRRPSLAPYTSAINRCN